MNRQRRSPCDTTCCVQSTDRTPVRYNASREKHRQERRESPAPDVLRTPGRSPFSSHPFSRHPPKRAPRQAPRCSQVP